MESSTWIGYYEQNHERPEMTFYEFNINQSSVNARGRDICGNFTYEGSILNKVFRAVKHYNGSYVYYHGNYDSDKSEIFGYWGFQEGAEQGIFKIQKMRNSQLDDFRADNRIRK